jgi:hypothetical protein
MNRINEDHIPNSPKFTAKELRAISKRYQEIKKAKMPKLKGEKWARF